jgi:hypothetical protein
MRSLDFRASATFSLRLSTSVHHVGELYGPARKAKAAFSMI